jgi:hypothetical protein
MNRVHYSVYAVERGVGGTVIRVTIEHPGVCRDLGENTRVVSTEPA